MSANVFFLRVAPPKKDQFSAVARGRASAVMIANLTAPVGQPQHTEASHGARLFTQPVAIGCPLPRRPLDGTSSGRRHSVRIFCRRKSMPSAKRSLHPRPIGRHQPRRKPFFARRQRRTRIVVFFAESSNGARCVVRSVQVLLVVFFFSVSVDSWPMESTRPRELKARTNDKLQRSQMRKERAGAILLHATRFLYFSKYFLYRRSLTEFRRF